MEMISNLLDYFYRFRSALLRTGNGVSATNQYHRQILEAKKKNPRLAERLVRMHLARAKELVLKEIEAERILP